MNCYECGSGLSSHDFCTNCGANVIRYKKIIRSSNLLYNFGLEKAAVRDLSGAILCLRQSLKCNKNNIDARNLLGLIYCEMGETVAALTQWVISKNVQSDKNIADDYLNSIQRSPSRLEGINETIKKYNQSLLYCQQDSLDLSVIQLKKVLSLNPKFVKAHQLLALIYINIEEWDKAKRELIKCQEIDTNNTTTLRYLREVDKMLLMEDDRQGKRKKNDGDVVTYRRGNDLVIQPLNTKEPTGVTTLVNIAIGSVIGLAIAWFLILPAKIQSAKADVNKQVVEYGESLDIKTSKINELEVNNKKLMNEVEELQTKLDEYTATDGTLEAYQLLLQATGMYLSDINNVTGVADLLYQIDENYILNNQSEIFQGTYSSCLEIVSDKAARAYYNSGLAEYKAENYDEAIILFTKAFRYNQDTSDSLYNLGNSYRLSGRKEEAIETYTKVVELYNGTNNAKRAKSYLAQYEES